MSRSTLVAHHLPLAALLGLAAVGAAADPGRAVTQPAPGLEVGYQQSGEGKSAPGQLDGSVATPAGTLRTTVRTDPAGNRQLERGDTTFDVDRLVPGQLQLRELQGGGVATTWRMPLRAGLGAETRGERTPVRNAQAVQLRQDLGGGNSAQAALTRSATPWAQGSRWDVELTRSLGLANWSLGLDSAERGYVTSSGGTDARAGVRLGTQWAVLPGTRMQANLSREVRWDTAEPLSRLLVGTSFALPRRAQLSTGVEIGSDATHKTSLTLTVPLEPH